MATAAAVVAPLSNAPTIPYDVPFSAPCPAEIASNTGPDTKDHMEREASDPSVSNTIGSTTTVDTLNGVSNGVSTPASNPPSIKGNQDDPVFTDASLDHIWSPATKLKHRLEHTKDLIVCPGVNDGFSARIALSVGFDAMYMGRVTADATLDGCRNHGLRLGMADLGVATRTDTKEYADMIANSDPSKILIADMDTGYGGAITIATTVNQYIRANVAGFHIEDQLLTKRCGHLAGKKVVDRETYLSRIKAAKAAKDKARSDIVLIARTDANQQHGYDECLTRLRAARDLGADVGLLEGFKSKEEARTR